MQTVASQLQTKLSVIKKTSLNYFDPIANSNKYYTLELHQDNNIQPFYVYIEYGRVGRTQQSGEYHFNTQEEAEKFYNKKLKEKIRKGYVEIDLVQSSTGTAEAQSLINAAALKKIQPKVNEVKNKSNLDPIIQSFVSQIYDEANQKLNHLVIGSYASDGASPLGKLSEFQIEKGRKILNEISALISNPIGNFEKKILQLTTEYYRQIPKAFGNKVKASNIILNNINKLQEEMEVLKFYEDSLRIGSVMFDNNNIDKQYEALNCKIGILVPEDPEYKRIVHYVSNTQSKYHHVALGVKQIFTVNQKKSPRFNKNIGNVKQLFHGSRSANMIGILSTHLKLPNQLHGVQTNGAMFGPGLYFADQSTKSSQYSCSRFGGTVNKYKTAFMFLADVALGKIKEEYASKYYFKAPDGYDSVKGCMGRVLLHNEYIIYKENQQKLRYIIEFLTKQQR